MEYVQGGMEVRWDYRVNLASRSRMGIVHNTDRIVNLLYCWKDLRGLVHLARRSRAPDFTLCIKSVAALKFAGRQDVSTMIPTCVLCIVG